MKLTFLDDGYKWLINQGENVGPVKTTLYVSLDPAGIEAPCLEIYSDDGKGNGNLILTIQRG